MDSENVMHLGDVFNFRSVWIAFLILNVPAELETEFHDAVEYPRDGTNVEERLRDKSREIPAFVKVQ